MSDMRRSKRLASLVKETLSKVLLQEVSDPALREMIVTEVEMTPDLKLATVFFSPGDPHLKEKELEKGFLRAKSFLKRRVSEELDLRYVPEMRFIHDKHTENLNHLLSVMKNVEEGHQQ